jgi:dienelactone hydrolase
MAAPPPQPPPTPPCSPCPAAPLADGSDDPLTDFAQRTADVDGSARQVYVAGRGPAVLVLSELPGISPQVARFARWVRDAGFTVYMPSLFGRDGAYPQAEEGLRVLKRVCVRAEFGALAAGASGPVTAWLRGLARLAHADCGGPGVGAVGMCFTGGFALSLMLDPVLLAAVLCQPSLPLNDPAGIQLSLAEAANIRERLEREDLTTLAYRFDGDRHCTAARFDSYARALGPRFVARVLPDAAAHPSPPPFFAQVVGCAHSVVTAHLIDAAGQPTQQARDEILAYLTLRLHRAAKPIAPAIPPAG